MKLFLAILLFAVSAQAQQPVSFAWQGNGDPIPPAGYMVCWGLTSGTWPTCIDAGTALFATTPVIPSGSYFAAGFAYNGSYLTPILSDPTNEVAFTISPTKPGLMKNFRKAGGTAELRFQVDDNKIAHIDLSFDDKPKDTQ